LPSLWLHRATNLIFGEDFTYGRYWIRTSDPFRVKEVRYHCANRPQDVSQTQAGLACASMMRISY
jgi:hypothetical protein